MLLRRALFALPAFFLLAATAHAVPAVGQAAPDFQLRDAAGKTVKLSDYRGKHVVLANKGPVAVGYRELLARAEQAGKLLRFEAINEFSDQIFEQ